VSEPPTATLLSTWMVRGPRSAFRWTAIVLAITAFGAAIPTPLYPAFEARFHFSALTLGLIFAAYTPGVFLTLFFVAPLGERIGRRKLLYLGMALTALAALLFTSASGVGTLALARGVSGLAVGATTSVATAAMSDLEPYRDQHHVARVAVAANFGGFAVGVLTSGLLVQYVGHPMHLIFIVAIAVGVFGLFAVYVTPETATDLGSKARIRFHRLRIPAECRRPFWVAAGGIAACYSIYGLFGALGPSYVRTELASTNALVVGGAIAAMFGMAAIVQLATAQIRDRRALLLGFPLLFAALVAFVLILLVASWPLFLAVTVVLGVAVGLTFMGSATLVDRIAPEQQRGGILAGYYLSGYLALAIPTIGVAEASEWIGLVDAGILFGSLLAVAVGLLYWSTSGTPTPPGGGGRPRDPARPPPPPVEN
jgi:MFS family permease